MGVSRPTGKCEGCGASPRKLVEIESGQWVCLPCLREIRGPKRPSHLAAIEDIEKLRGRGIQVSDDLTKKEYRRIERELNAPKVYGVEELARIYRRYATLKGWSTHEKVVSEKIADWNHDGPVQLAIEFHETGIDRARYLGYDAESRAAEGSDRILQLATTVAGMEYHNNDGSNRKEIVDGCRPFEKLALTHEPDNRYDVNAVAVHRTTGEQLGYIPRKLAAEIVGEAQLGFSHFAFFWEKAQRYGSEEVRLIIVICRPGVTSEERMRYCQRWIRERPPNP
jgi:hypothetical protein